MNSQLEMNAELRDLLTRTEIKYLVRARRATLRVLPEGQVRITVPKGVSKREVIKIIINKFNWIRKKQVAFEKLPVKEKPIFIEDGVFPFMGQNVVLKVILEDRKLSLSENRLELFIPESTKDRLNYAKKAIIDWYQKQAIEKINERIQFYASQLGVCPKRISIKNYKSRWGACSGKGELIFNWQIVTFEQRYFDYVIAHELCHLKEMNHSKNFYALLKQLGFEKRIVHKEMRMKRNFF